MVVAQGAPTAVLADDDVQRLLAQAFDTDDLDGRRVLALIPDSTRAR